MAAKKTKPSAKPTATKAKTSAKKAAPVKTAPVKAAKIASKPKSAGAVVEGSKAPLFSLGDETGAVVNSASLAGKPYVLYFYPKDDTPGCTTEACDFRDNLRAFNNAKVRVIGVSPDDAKRHAKFKEKYGLTFTLLSDTDKQLVNAYGVWVEKQNYGRSYMGVERSTFLIDKSGTVKKIWRKVRVPGHVANVLAAL
ncbi:MAG TPA: thioredoxin-dependent thiol peroxidase [Polyangiaceae bacterium]|nr:thioredoxin-dependent thiol peroxidase [Polyangiaceae bacterium]